MSEAKDFPLQQIANHFTEVLRKAPRVLANDSVNFFLDRFKDQAWLGSSREPWVKRKKVTRWGTTPRNNGRAILIDSGRLRRSIKITSVTSEGATIGTDVPYAKAHNEGLRLGLIQKVKSFSRKTNKGNTSIVKAHTRRINMQLPKRQFMGDSPYLTNTLKRNLTASLLKGIPKNI